MNKPLKKEDREAIVEFNQACIAQLLSAEAYWRKQFANSPESEITDFGQTHFCLSCDAKAVIMENLPHATDCPWKLAQES